MTSRPEQDGLIDPAAFRIHLVAERVSLAWPVVAAAMVAIQAAHDAVWGRLLVRAGRWSMPLPSQRFPVRGLW